MESASLLRNCRTGHGRWGLDSLPRAAQYCFDLCDTFLERPVACVHQDGKAIPVPAGAVARPLVRNVSGDPKVSLAAVEWTGHMSPRVLQCGRNLRHESAQDHVPPPLRTPTNIIGVRNDGAETVHAKALHAASRTDSIRAPSMVSIAPGSCAISVITAHCLNNRFGAAVRMPIAMISMPMRSAASNAISACAWLCGFAIGDHHQQLARLGTLAQQDAGLLHRLVHRSAATSRLPERSAMFPCTLSEPEDHLIAREGNHCDLATREGLQRAGCGVDGLIGKDDVAALTHRSRTVPWRSRSLFRSVPPDDASETAAHHPQEHPPMPWC